MNQSPPDMHQTPPDMLQTPPDMHQTMSDVMIYIAVQLIVKNRKSENFQKIAKLSWGAGNWTKILVCKSWPARFTQMSQVDGTTGYKLDQPVLQKYKNTISDTSAHGDWRKLLRSATKLQILNCHHFLQTRFLQLAHWHQLNTQVLTS